MSLSALVFVFGTLKEGFPNHHINGGRRVPGSFITKERLPLYLVGERSSPWLIKAPGEGFQVSGQVFEVDGTTLTAMDRLERVHDSDGYVRETIEVIQRGAKTAAAVDGTVLLVQAYLKPRALLTPELRQRGPLAEYTLEHARLYWPRAL
jgi:gamma-glutamylaminecyclotransferase